VPGRLVGDQFVMSWYAAAPLFLVSLVVTLSAARLFARRLDRLGVRFGFPEALIGLLTALAADGPEISSALFALIRGAHSVSVGVLVGSNAFNLAAMIGLSALLAGCVRLRLETLLLEGFFGAAITLLAAALLLGWIGAGVAAVLAAVVTVPYLLVVIGGSEFLLRRRRSRGLGSTLAERPARVRESEPGERPTHHLLGLVVVDLGLILAGSAGMVQAALALGDHWHLSRAALGVLVLAPLTSIPNAMTGVRLGRAGRATALVGETFNSNTINLAGGVIIPALFTSMVALDTRATVQLAWLVVMTGVCLALLGTPRGMRRGGALALITMYAGFVVTQVT
jgi:cation:H+ antiporter